MTDTENKVAEIIAKHLGVEIPEVTADKAVIDDLGGDSLDLVEMVMALEEHFDIEITDEEAEKLLSVGDFMRQVDVSLKAKN